MASQPETSTYGAVYQWETTDPVLGGLGGVGNLPLLQLSSRTKFLYDAATVLSAVVAGKANNDSPSLTGSPKSVTPAPGAFQLEIATAAFVHGLAGGISYVPIAGNTYLTAAQVGAAVIVVSGALSADAYVLLPAGTGRWTVFNATTAAAPAAGFALLVRQAAGGASVRVSNGTDKTIWTDGANVFDARTDFYGIGLGGISTAPTPQAADSSAQIPNTSWVTGAIARLAATSGALDTERQARIQGDSALLQDLSAYAPLSAFGVGPGHQILPGGTMLQWGSGTTNTAAGDVFNFPNAFPNQCFAVVASEDAAAGWGGAPPQPTVYGTHIVNQVGFQLWCAKWTGARFDYLGGTGFNYLAIGN